MNELKTSIALCTFNGEKYLSEQLQSLFDQTILPDEIVVSDDGSSDQTLNIVHTFANLNIIPIRILEHKENLGVFKNFVYCIKECKGDFVFTCDQDDYWMPNKLEKHLQMHRLNPNAELIYSNAEVVLNTLDNILYPLWEPNQINDTVNGKASYTSLVVKGQSIAGCCMSFRKDFFDKILPIPNKIYHDDWIATSACLSGNIIGISEALIKYRQHGNNVVGIIRGRRLSYFKSLFTNVPFYVKSDEYIAQRHHLIYDAMESHSYLNQFLIDRNISEIVELYDSRSNYASQGFIESIGKLSSSLIKGYYRHLNGLLTYLKDVYNVIFINLFKKRNQSN